jgi:hypothetical protein
MGGMAEESVSVSVRPSAAFAPAAIRILATVERNPENRFLIVTAESEEYVRSSSVQLDGELGARVHQFLFDQLPAGVYRITATVERAGGHDVLAKQELIVSGRRPR